MALPFASGWRSLASRGLAELSPPEAQHALLELPTDRPEYIRVLEDMGDWPARSPLGRRTPAQAEVEALDRSAGRWRTVVFLQDERALGLATGLFESLLILDPLYDSGELLYAAWHDPNVGAGQARRLAIQAARLVRAAPVLHSGAGILAPDHLPGSWDPRPAAWREPPPRAAERDHVAWALRQALVLVYWADRLDAVVTSSLQAIDQALRQACVQVRASQTIELAEPPGVAEAALARQAALANLQGVWSRLTELVRRRSESDLESAAHGLGTAATRVAPEGAMQAWRLSVGEDASLVDPALLLRRALRGEDVQRAPALPRKGLRRPPLWLTPALRDHLTPLPPSPGRRGG